MRRLVNRRVSRREFLRVSALAGAGAVTVACGAAGEPAPAAQEAAPAPAAQEAAPAAQEAAPATSASGYSEAPMLSELVAAGELPSVDERLPVNPMVMPVAEMTGNYGGIISRGFRGVSDRWGPTKCKDRGMAWYDQNLNMQPRIAESWEINEDSSGWTFHLREGMKWSDGAPFTARDIEWWWQNDETNTTVSPSVGGAYVSGPDRTPMQVEVLDDHTFTCTFADPKPLFIFELGRITRDFYLPGHYLSQFHMDLTEDQDGLQAATDEAGFNSWEEYYVDRRYWYNNPDYPDVGPWVAKNELANELFVMERNPYFFAVDEDGQQLPYLDGINHRLFETNDVFDLRIINGEIDFQGRHVNVGNFTLYKENEDAGDYRVLIGPRSSHIAVQLNLTTKDEILRKFFNNRDVRVALSVAVDRVAINELVYDGLFTPRQYSPISISPQAYPKQANAHIEYNPEQANELLDAAGYSEKDGDGFRIDPDSGETISFIIEGTAQSGSTDEDAILQIIQYYQAVGVKAAYKPFERSLYEEHWGANEIEAAFWGGDRTVLPLVDPSIFICTQPDRPWAAAWAHWKNSSGTNPNGEEPPEGHWIWDIWSIWDQVSVETDTARQTELFYQILDIWAEELPMLGYLGEAPGLIIARNGFRNYISGQPMDNETGDEHLLNTETYFWEDPAAHST